MGERKEQEQEQGGQQRTDMALRRAMAVFSFLFSCGLFLVRRPCQPRVIRVTPCSTNVAGTGAWYLCPNGTETAPGYRGAANHLKADEGVGRLLLELFRPGQRILDLGCGIGQYGHYFRQHAPQLQWEGYDGAINVEEFTDGFVRHADLVRPISPAHSSYDWLMCLEVGEHVPKLYQDSIVRNIGSYGDCGAVVSWGLPRQDGFHHVNLLTNAQVAALLAPYGLDLDHKMTQRRSASKYFWFRESLMVFRKTDAPARCSFQ